MMSDPSSIDSTTVDELTGKLVLVIEEKRNWHEPDLMHRQLAAKVKNYVRYVRSPEFSARHNQRPQQTIVRLVTDAPPADSSLPFLERVAYELSKHGMTFEQQVGEYGTPAPVAARADASAPPIPQEPASRPTSAPGPPAAPEPPPVPPQPPAAAQPPPQVPEPLAPEPPVPEPPVEEPAPEPGWSDWQETDSETAEVESMDEGWGVPDEPTYALDAEGGPGGSIDPEPIELEPEAGASDSLPSFDESYGWDEPATSATEEGDVGGESFPEFLDVTEAGRKPPVSEPSELETLIESDDAEVEFIGGEPGAELQGGDDEDRPRPEFFPEEEFGRATPGKEDVEFLDLDSDTAVIETSSGQRVRLEVDPDAAAAGVIGVERPSLFRAIGAGIVAAIAGGVVWGLLAIAAAEQTQSVHPLAVAVGVMVGISVRLRGNGHSMAYRIVGMLFTLIGSALGTALAAAALSAMLSGEGISQAIAILSDLSALIAALKEHFKPLSIVSLGLALYIAFRLSASKPSAE